MPEWVKPRGTGLTTVEMYHLDEACDLIRQAFGTVAYLVGSVVEQDGGTKGTYRDVDVRLMLDDEEYVLACPTQHRWELLCLSLSTYLASRTGLRIDFQIQRTREANERYGDKPRTPLGVGRVFAGGGDATPPKPVTDP